MAQVIASANSAVVSLTPVQTDWFLKDPKNPSRNMPIDVEAPFSSTPSEKNNAVRPLGRKNAVVLSDGMTGTDGKLTITTNGNTEFQNLMTLLNSQNVLLLQSPYGSQWYVRFIGDRPTSLLDSPGSSPVRVVSLTYVEVDKP